MTEQTNTTTQAPPVNPKNVEVGQIRTQKVRNADGTTTEFKVKVMGVGK